MVKNILDRSNYLDATGARVQNQIMKKIINNYWMRFL